MFDLSKRKYVNKPKVKDLIAILEGENLEATLTIDGLDEFFIHVTEDENHLGIDVDSLDYEYSEKYPDEELSDDYEPFVIEYGMSRLDCLDLLSKVVDNVEESTLLEYGFKEDQIKEIKGE